MRANDAAGQKKSAPVRCGCVGGALMNSTALAPKRKVGGAPSEQKTWPTSSRRRFYVSCRIMPLRWPSYRGHHETAAIHGRLRHALRRPKMSRQRSVWIVSAALLCLTLPRPAAAQDTGADGSAQREAALQALRPGQLVRISAHGVRDTGRVAAASSSQLTFRHPDPVARPVASIDSLWTWKSNAGGGARIGAIVVGTLGALVGYS